LISDLITLTFFLTLLQAPYPGPSLIFRTTVSFWFPPSSASLSNNTHLLQFWQSPPPYPSELCRIKMPNSSALTSITLETCVI
jgi:hypothetical protein